MITSLQHSIAGCVRILPVLILASSSPRRSRLLSLLGLDFKVISTPIDESPLPGEMPADYVLRIAAQKAAAVAGTSSPEDVVIAADTLVVLDGRFLGKPSSPEEAIDMLRSLRHRSHHVYSGLVVSTEQGKNQHSDWCMTEVTMRAYTDEEIQSYVASGDPLDKAGAYAIQHHGFYPVEKVAGCYMNVVGLPLCHLACVLSKIGHTPPNDMTQNCITHQGYNCQLTHMLFKETGAPPQAG